VSEALRSRCRRCGAMIEPTENPRSAFCTPGCHRYWYAGHCMACEAPKTTSGQYCKKRDCRIELASLKRYGVMGKFHQKRATPTHVALRSEARSGTPIFIAPEGLSKPVDRWRIVAGPTLTKAALHLATVPDGGAYRRCENDNHTALVKAGLASEYADPVRLARQAKVDHAEIEANGCFEEMARGNQHRRRAVLQMTEADLDQAEFSPWPKPVTTDELHAMVRMLQADSPLGEISNMQARTVFELAIQRGFKIIPPTTQNQKD
jgi:hypothetical protein